MPEYTTTFTNKKLDPFYKPEEALELPVRLAQGTYQRGQLLGEVSATPGLFKAYADAAVDGSGVARAALSRACTVDAQGKVTIDDRGAAVREVYAYFSGYFDTTDLVGLDAAAVNDLNGRLIYGTVANGVIKF